MEGFPLVLGLRSSFDVGDDKDEDEDKALRKERFDHIFAVEKGEVFCLTEAR